MRSTVALKLYSRSGFVTSLRIRRFYEVLLGCTWFCGVLLSCSIWNRRTLKHPDEPRRTVQNLFRPSEAWIQRGGAGECLLGLLLATEALERATHLIVRRGVLVACHHSVAK